MQTLAEGVKGRLAKKRARESVENTQHNSIYSNKLTVRNETGQRVESGNQMRMEWSLGCLCLLGLSLHVCVCVCSICKLRNRLGKYFLWVPETAC